MAQKVHNTAIKEFLKRSLRKFAYDKRIRNGNFKMKIWNTMSMECSFKIHVTLKHNLANHSV